MLPMSEVKTIPIEQYFDPRPGLKERFDELCDVQSFPHAGAPGLPAALMAFIQKYALEFFRTDVDVLRLWRDLLRGGEFNPRIGEMLQARKDASGVPEMGAGGSLLDVRATAALVREIAFAEHGRLRESEPAFGADFGSGSNILTVAAAISAVRHKADSLLVAYEMNLTSLANAQRICAELDGHSSHGQEVGIIMKEADVSRSDPYVLLRESIEQLGQPLRYWISETFNIGIPPYEVRDYDVRWVVQHEPRERELLRFTDPFIQVVEQSCVHLPEFLKNVREGETFMFPDLVRGRIRFVIAESALKIQGHGEEWIPFGNVGDDFQEYEDYGLHTRFATREQYAEIFKGEEKEAWDVQERGTHLARERWARARTERLKKKSKRQARKQQRRRNR